MKKIMFNDKYGLTQAVLEGRKTQTRRIISLTPEDEEYLSTAFDWELRESVIIERYARYKVGEEVAVAQSYHDAKKEVGGLKALLEGHPLPSANGIKNKMFVKPDLMPHRIKITNIRIERLQDISPEDCKKEGVWFNANDKGWYYGEEGTPYRLTSSEPYDWRFMAKLAYSKLINKVSGKGTWKSNPWVFVYDLELVK